MTNISKVVAMFALVTGVPALADQCDTGLEFVPKSCIHEIKKTFYRLGWYEACSSMDGKLIWVKGKAVCNLSSAAIPSPQGSMIVGFSETTEMPSTSPPGIPGFTGKPKVGVLSWENSSNGTPVYRLSPLPLGEGGVELLQELNVIAPE